MKLLMFDFSASMVLKVEIDCFEFRFDSSFEKMISSVKFKADIKLYLEHSKLILISDQDIWLNSDVDAGIRNLSKESL